jgi:hypothetical protein
MRLAASFVCLAALTTTLVAQDAPLAGNWKLTIIENAEVLNFWLVRLENKADGWSGEAVALEKVPPTKIKDIKVGADLVEFRLELANGASLNFQGKTPRPGAKKVLGSMKGENRAIPAYLEATAAKNAFEVKRELVTRTPNDPRVFDITLELIENAKENKAGAKDVQEWVETALGSAESYGPRLKIDYMLRVIETLAAEKDYAGLAGSLAVQAEKLLDPKGPAPAQLASLTTLASALRKADLAEQAGAIEARIDKLETSAYEDYSKASIEYKLAKFAGRKGKSDRAVLVELFTGTMCPPCVAADLAFDGLERTYAPKDVVLLQYHLHIPGPDPMTNGDAEKRAEFYGRNLRGTPSIFFNGKADAPGGGPREDAEDKYNEYRAVIEKQLELPTAVQIEANAQRKGDKITISASVKGVEKPAETMRLRFALVEDWVRYKARNGTNYHHRVVRALPGGPAGVAIMKNEMDHSVTVDLNDVRAGLNKYLDDYIKNVDPFPDAQRPLRMQDLHVVAFVQNDDNYEVLQAVDVPVK